MNGDITRSTFDPNKQYTGVRHQQGRVVLDADLNEQSDIELFDTRQTRIDVIGRTGAPEGNAGFEISTDGTSLTIGAGRYYVDGIRVECPTSLDFGEQAHAPTLPTTDGLYLAVLHVWERPIDAIADPHIREVALGGPDTATRTKLVFRVELLPVTTEVTDPGCTTSFVEWDRLLAGSTAQLRVRLAEGTSQDPCSIPEDAGYRGLENQLYRIEVHAPNFDPSAPGAVDPALTPTFKWSRDNGAVVAAWTAHDSTLELTIDRLGPGGTQGFAPGQWVEISDDDSELAAAPGLLAQIDSVGETSITLLDDMSGTVAAALASAFDADAHPRVRRWDSSGARPLAVDPAELGSGDVTADGWIRLEAGIEVRFEGGAVRPFDHWLLPARTAALPGTTGRQLDWPTDPSTGEYLARLADGRAHHYARLAVLRREGGNWSATDCRPLFPPLTDLPEPVAGNGCGEIVIGVGADIGEALVDLGVAQRGESGDLVPGTTDALRLCFQPGEHAIGNLAFADWNLLSLGGIGAEAVVLRGRFRATNCRDVTLRDLHLTDTDANGGRIAAPDDDVMGRRFRWRTRTVEIREALDVTVERVHVEFLDPRWRLKDGQAIHVALARDVRVRDCVVRVPRGQNGIRMQNVVRALVEGNRVEQDWTRDFLLSDLSPGESAELGSWVGRLLIDLRATGNRTGSFVNVTSGSKTTGYDRGAFRLGFGPSGEGYWIGETTTLGFLTRSSDGSGSRGALSAAARTLANALHGTLNLSNLLPRGTSTSANDIGSVRLQIERSLQIRRAELGRRVLSGTRLTDQVAALQPRLVASDGRWLAGLGGTGIRVAVDAGSETSEGSVRVSGNWVADFSVGVEATFREEVVGSGRIQTVEVCHNVLRLRSPLLPVQRGGIIVGGARRLRVEANDVDVLEGSSHGFLASRGWFVGVDGIRARGAQGAWLGVRDNQIRGCAVGVRRTGSSQTNPAEAPSPVRVLADNSFLACDQEVIWFNT